MQVPMLMKGDADLAYETKVLLQAIAEILLQKKDVKSAYNAVKRIANTEGVILKTYDEAIAELEAEKQEEGEDKF